MSSDHDAPWCEAVRGTWRWAARLGRGCGSWRLENGTSRRVPRRCPVCDAIQGGMESSNVGPVQKKSRNVICSDRVSSKLKAVPTRSTRNTDPWHRPSQTNKYSRISKSSKMGAGDDFSQKWVPDIGPVLSSSAREAHCFRDHKTIFDTGSARYP